MKRFRSCALVFVLLLLVLMGVGQYFLSPRADLRHAFNIDRLPRSVQIEEWHRDAWTDYIFVAVISIDPDDFDKLLLGRDFELVEESDFFMPPSVFFLQDFETAEAWQWNTDAPSNNGFYANSLITVNDSRDRVAVHFLAD